MLNEMAMLSVSKKVMRIVSTVPVILHEKTFAKLLIRVSRISFLSFLGNPNSL